MKIRKAKKKDLPKLRNLCFEAHKELSEFSKDIIINEQTKREVNQEVNSVLKDLFTQVFVAERNGKVVGNVYVFFAPGLRREGTISNLFVVKSERGEGVGSELIIKAINWLKHRGIKNVRMVVHRENKKALSFLRKFGFKKEPIKVFWLTKVIS